MSGLLDRVAVTHAGGVDALAQAQFDLTDTGDVELRAETVEQTDEFRHRTRLDREANSGSGYRGLECTVVHAHPLWVNGQIGRFGQV